MELSETEVYCLSNPSILVSYQTIAFARHHTYVWPKLKVIGHFVRWLCKRYFKALNGGGALIIEGDRGKFDKGVQWEYICEHFKMLCSGYYTDKKCVIWYYKELHFLESNISVNFELEKVLSIPWFQRFIFPRSFAMKIIKINLWNQGILSMAQCFNSILELSEYNRINLIHPYI